jgi:hypothetical protein
LYFFLCKHPTHEQQGQEDSHYFFHTHTFYKLN